MRIQTLWWVQNLNLRHIYLIRFFARLAQSLKKYWYDIKKKILKKSKKVSTQKFMLISNPLEKFLKIAPQKSYKQNKFHEYEKKWKKCIFPSYFCYNFFVHFFKTFSTDLKSAWNSAFLIPFSIFRKNNFVKVILVLFSSIFLPVIRLNFAFQIGLNKEEIQSNFRFFWSSSQYELPQQL